MINVRQHLPFPSGTPGSYTSLPHIEPWNIIRHETLGSGVDYDGTIARNDRLDPDVLDAIGIACRRGVTVLLSVPR